MKSKATTTIKDVQSKIRKTEIRIYSKKGDSPLNEQFEHFNSDDEVLKEQEEAEIADGNK